MCCRSIVLSASMDQLLLLLLLLLYVMVYIVVVTGQRRSRRNHSIINPASLYVLFVRVVILFLSHTCGVPIGRLFLLLFRYKQPIFSPRVLLLYSCFGNMMMMDQEENDNLSLIHI